MVKGFPCIHAHGLIIKRTHTHIMLGDRVQTCALPFLFFGVDGLAWEHVGLPVQTYYHQSQIGLSSCHGQEHVP